MNATWKKALLLGVLSMGLGGATLVMSPAAKAAEVVIREPVHVRRPVVREDVIVEKPIVVPKPVATEEWVPGHEQPAHFDRYGTFIPAHWVPGHYITVR